MIPPKTPSKPRLRPLLAFTVAALLSAGAVFEAQAEPKRIAITTIVEVPQLVEVKEGIIKGLADLGYRDGETVLIEYQNAQGNFGTAQQIARKFAGDAPDVIVPITTPSSQAVVATVGSEQKVVFSTVAEPLRAKLVPRLKQPGGNVTGVSDFAPITQQLDLFAEILPNLKTLGVVYNPGLDNSQAYVDALKAEADTRGWMLRPAPAPTTNEVIAAGRSLIGKVDAIYVPNDSTVLAALESLVKLAQDADTPLFTGETRGVQRGSIATVGYNYFEVGEITAGVISRVLEGTDPGTIDVVVMPEAAKRLQLHINKSSAEAMGVAIPASVLGRADMVY